MLAIYLNYFPKFLVQNRRHIIRRCRCFSLWYVHSVRGIRVHKIHNQFPPKPHE